MKPVFRLPLRVYYEDTDAGGIVYYANYLRFLERARTEWLRQLGCSRETLRAQTGWVFVVTEVSAKYLKPARLDDWLVVESTLTQSTAARLVFDQRVCRDDITLLSATVQVACIDSTHHRPRRIPAELLAQFESPPCSGTRSVSES